MDLQNLDHEATALCQRNRVLGYAKFPRFPHPNPTVYNRNYGIQLRPRKIQQLTSSTCPRWATPRTACGPLLPQDLTPPTQKPPKCANDPAHRNSLRLTQAPLSSVTGIQSEIKHQTRILKVGEHLQRQGPNSQPERPSNSTVWGNQILMIPWHSLLRGYRSLLRLSISSPQSLVTPKITHRCKEIFRTL